MPLNIPKKKPAEQVTVKETKIGPDHGPLIDAVGLLQPEAIKLSRKIEDLQEKLKPYIDAEKALQKALDEDEDLDVDFEGVIKGETHQVTVGKRGTKREIADMAGVKSALTTKVFMEVATVTLKDLDKYLTEAQRDKVLTTSRTKRSVKDVVARKDL